MRLRKKSLGHNSQAEIPVQAQFQSHTLADSAQAGHSNFSTESQADLPQVQRQFEQAQSFGHNFGQLEVQPTLGGVIQPKPMMDRSLKNSERGGALASEQVVGEMNIPAQLTPIQRQPIQREGDTDKKVETWDQYANEGKGAFVDSTIPSRDYIDKVTAKDATGLYKYKEEFVTQCQATNKPIPDGRFFKNKSVQKEQNTNLNNLLADGLIEWVALERYLNLAKLEDIYQLDPKSNLVKNILKKPLKQSWHIAKEKLALSDSPIRQALMKKLWEFRQWHYQEILQRTQRKLNAICKDGLTDWPSAGSTSLTSDIDVNLKGKKTEYAVEFFNQTFKEDGFNFESGVVYDVNVYALDFMHAFKGVEVTQDGVTHKLSGKEGKRKDIKQGGLVFEPNQEKDMEAQDEWSLVKLRLYMTQEQWNNYQTQVSLSPEMVQKVERKYKNYQQELNQEMQNQAGAGEQTAGIANQSGSGIEQINDTADQLAQNSQKIKPSKSTPQIPETTIKINQNILLSKLHKEEQKSTKKLAILEHQARGFQRHEQKEKQSVIAEDYKIAASNRIYEEKLKNVAGMRYKIKGQIAKFEELKNLVIEASKPENKAKNLPKLRFAMALQNQRIESQLQQLREIVSEAALYSNEAYITDGAVNHAVVGLQGGNAIEQTKAELMNAVTENLADALKEIGRHGSSLGEAAYKAAKYYMRMADAAKNMGYGQQGEEMEKVERLYEAGYYISVSLKNKGGLTEDKKQQESEQYIRNHLGIDNSVAELKQAIMAVGIKISQKFRQKQKEEQLALGLKAPAEKGAISHN